MFHPVCLQPMQCHQQVDWVRLCDRILISGLEVIVDVFASLRTGIVLGSEALGISLVVHSSLAPQIKASKFQAQLLEVCSIKLDDHVD